MKTLFKCLLVYVGWAIILSLVIWKPILAAWMFAGAVVFIFWLLLRMLLKKFGIRLPHIHRWHVAEHDEFNDVKYCLSCNKYELIEKE